ncbi:fimbrial protein, partial [Mesorhizobium sanjuanii]
MARPLAEEDPDVEGREKPLDPEVESVRRKLVRFMAINLGLLFLALM